ncbi:MAG: alpha/beta hydrolase [Gemmataceae bacterium]|nr:alpha/beta hydrolase [Gemmataceae bacterium]
MPRWHHPVPPAIGFVMLPEERVVTWLAIGALCWAMAPDPAAARGAEAGPFEVESHLDVPYYDGPEAHPVRHKLDLLLPKGRKDYPVLVLVHGGVWMGGDKSYRGKYTAVGKCLAGIGVGVVLPNYRLSPAVQHPEHVRDVARAFAWTHRNIARYGGRPDYMFVGGHSAGGHLAALLAVDDRYLQEHRLDRRAIRGVVCASGIFSLPEFSFTVSLGTNGEGWDFGWSPLRLVFGSDPRVRREASPIHHVRPGLPPFLVLCAERDLPTFARDSKAFYEALRECRNEAEFFVAEGRTHWSVLFAATRPDDPVVRKVAEFITRYVR